MAANSATLARLTLLSAILIAAGGCASIDPQRDHETSDSYSILMPSESGMPARMVIPKVDPPPGAPTCEETGSSGMGHGKVVGAGRDTLRLEPPLRKRRSQLTVLPGAPGYFAFNELPESYPAVFAPGPPGRPVRITMSAAGCSWDPERVLVVYEWVPARSTWLERGRASFPEEWVATGVVPSLNSRFALGTAN